MYSKTNALGLKKIFISIVLVLVSFLSINLVFGNNDIICTKEYKPVCWERQKVLITYPNKCELEKADARFMYKWKCQKEWKIEDKKIKLTKSMKWRIDKIMENFILKLNNTELIVEKKLEKLDKIVYNIKKLKIKKPKFEYILNYLYSKIEEEKTTLRIEIQKMFSFSFEKECVNLGWKWSEWKWITGKWCDFWYSSKNLDLLQKQCTNFGWEFTTCGSGCGFGWWNICPSVCVIMCKFVKKSK